MNFLDIVKNVAPLLAGTFGTPLAGLAVKTLLGVIPDEHQAAAQEAAAKGPEVFLQHIAELFQKGVVDTAAVKQAEITHAERMAELGYKSVSDLAKIDADDRDSARKRQMELKDKTPANLAYMLIGGFIVVSLAQLVAFIGFPEQVAKVPPQGWVIIGNISGYLFAEAKQAGSYFFGSTAHNGAKDETIADLAKGNQ